jgi:hypothetical protein
MHNNYTTNALIQELSLGYYYDNKNKNKNNYTTTDNCHFALCESCFWSATIFKSYIQEHKTNTCPVCFNVNSISLIPLKRDEAYELSVRSKGGLEIKFSRLMKSTGY